jgi:hypothetical protein
MLRVRSTAAITAQQQFPSLLQAFPDTRNHCLDEANLRGGYL